MKAGFSFTRFGCLISLILYVEGKAEPFQLQLSGGSQQIQLSWPAAISNGVQGTVLPEYEVQYSTDLQHWVPIGGKVRAIQGLSGPTLNIRLEPQTGPIFYRAVADPGTTTPNETGSGGAE